MPQQLKLELQETQETSVYLKRLPPEVAIDLWQVLKEMIRLSSTKRLLSDQELASIQRSVATKSTVVWLIKRGEENCGLFLTSLQNCPITSEQTLLLHGLYGLSYLENTIWTIGLETLQEYCQERGIGKMVAYSNHPAVLRRLEGIGADTSYRRVELPVSTKENKDEDK